MNRKIDANIVPATDPAPPVGPRDPRQERRDRWRRPLAGRYDRLRAWTNMILVDHAFFRMVYLNLHRISPGACRAAQPLPYQIRALARRGLRTVVTLRGGQSFGSYPLEVEACARAGLNFETFALRSRALPSAEDIFAAKALFERIEYPVLFHCKSGADRAGVVSALFLVIHEGRPVTEARHQLALRFGHIRRGRTGLLDCLFDAYLTDHPDEAVGFLDWVATGYDPAAITAAFRSGGIGDFLTERVLRRE